MAWPVIRRPLHDRSPVRALSWAVMASWCARGARCRGRARVRGNGAGCDVGPGHRNGRRGLASSVGRPWSSPVVGGFCATGSRSGPPSHSQRQNPALSALACVSGRQRARPGRPEREELSTCALRPGSAPVSFRRGICFQVFVRFLIGPVWAHAQFLESDWRSHVVAGPPSGNREKTLD